MMSSISSSSNSIIIISIIVLTMTQIRFILPIQCFVFHHQSCWSSSSSSRSNVFDLVMQQRKNCHPHISLLSSSYLYSQKLTSSITTLSKVKSTTTCHFSSSSSSSSSSVNNVNDDKILIEEVVTESTSSSLSSSSSSRTPSIWEQIASAISINTNNSNNNDNSNNYNNKEQSIEQSKEYSQTVSLLRTGIPSIVLASLGKIIYPSLSIYIATIINDTNVFTVIANDYSQYIQNILTTSGLVFALLVGQTYYFMYQQQESIYLALYTEVSITKILLEQIALVCQGRDVLYQQILLCINSYIQNDLLRFNDVEPAYLISSRPIDDPLEDILYLTSVGEPSIVYGTVKDLRLARARRLGSLQKKLPELHTFLLWTLFTIVLITFPLLGAGSQTIGGTQLLIVQSYYFSIIIFGMSLVMNIISELQRPNDIGAYNARSVLLIMVQGLNDELYDRINNTIPLNAIVNLNTITNVNDNNIIDDENRLYDSTFYSPSNDS